MGEAVAVFFQQIEKMLPERYRVRIVACSAFMGMIGLFYYGQRHYATAADLVAVKAQLASQMTLAVKPLSDEIKSDEDTSRHRYMDDLRSQILQNAARCSETKDQEALQLYRQALGDLLQRYETAAGNPYPQSVGC